MQKANKQALKVLGSMSAFWTLFPILSGFVPPFHFLGMTFYGPLGLNWETMRALTATICVIYAGIGTTAGYILATAYLYQQAQKESRSCSWCGGPACKDGTWNGHPSPCDKECCNRHTHA